MFKVGQQALYTPYDGGKPEVVTIKEVDPDDKELPYQFAIEEDGGHAFWSNYLTGKLTPLLPPENV